MSVTNAGRDSVISTWTAIEPHTSSTAQSLRYRDATLEPRVRMVRIVAETQTDTVVAA